MSARKIGGIWFCRIGRWRISFCKATPKTITLHIAGRTITVRI